MGSSSTLSCTHSISLRYNVVIHQSRITTILSMPIVFTRRRKLSMMCLGARSNRQLKKREKKNAKEFYRSPCTHRNGNFMHTAWKWNLRFNHQAMSTSMPQIPVWGTCNPPLTSNASRVELNTNIQS